MKRQAFALVAALLLTAAPLRASQGGPKPKSPKPQASVTKPVKPTTTAKVKPVSTQHTAPKTLSGKPTKTTVGKPVKSTMKDAKAWKTTTKTTKSAKSDTRTSKTADVATATSTDTKNPSTAERVTLSPVQQKLQRNTKLADKLRDRLPDGVNLLAAAKDFKNLGQFVAAVNASHNHDYKFWELKRLMVKEGYSLGQAMQKIKADPDTSVTARRCETEAKTMIATTEREIAAPAGVTATNSASAPITTTAKSKAKPKQSKRTVGG
jgi:hypothetical protein